MSRVLARLQTVPPGAAGWRRRAWLAAALAAGARQSWARAPSLPPSRVPVLVYHRVAPTAEDGMTLRLANFRAHLRVLQDGGCTVIPLAQLVAWRLGRRETLPPRPVVLSVDDGHRSVHEQMAPLLAERRWPVTLFVYPSAISNAAYAMRWAQLRELLAQGHYTVESHTYWHPNLLRERRSRSAEDFQRFAEFQLRRSRAVLEDRLGQPVTRLAWPFGLFDAGLMALAAEAGYEAAFALGGRPSTRADPVHGLPRHLMVDSIDARQLARLLAQAHGGEGAGR